ncbi:hypothetical protein V6Z11_A10G178600 [Gossypium hirsutum]
MVGFNLYSSCLYKKLLFLSLCFECKIKGLPVESTRSLRAKEGRRKREREIKRRICFKVSNFPVSYLIPNFSLLL